MAPEINAKSILERAQANPVWWVSQVLGDSLWAAQKKIIESVRDNRTTTVRSCHGVGKSFIASRCALWFLMTHPGSIVITTAPTERQVRGILWKEIRSAHAKSKAPLGGTVQQLKIDLAEDWFAWGFTAPDYDPDRFQGFHAEHLLVVVDEASGVSTEIFDGGISSLMSSEGARLLMIGNPTDSMGEFARSFKTPGVEKFRIDAYQTPNFTKLGITEDDIASGEWKTKSEGKKLPHPYLVTPDWVADRYKAWGPTSPLYQARVKAEFPNAGTDTLIPLSHLEQARNRNLIPEGPKHLGVDIARFGSDETVVMKRIGPVARVEHAVRGYSTMRTAGLVKRALVHTGADWAKVDSIGIGAGVIDALHEGGVNNALECCFASSAVNKDGYINLRAEAYWNLKELFERGEIDIDPRDDDLLEQLANLKYKFNSHGKIQIMSKKEMKAMGLPSPDRADALAMAFTPVNNSELVVLW